MSSAVLSQSAASSADPQLYATSVKVGGGGLSLIESPNLVMKIGRVSFVFGGPTVVVIPELQITGNANILLTIQGPNTGGTTAQWFPRVSTIVAGTSFEIVCDSGGPSALPIDIMYCIVSY